MPNNRLDLNELKGIAVKDGGKLLAAEYDIDLLAQLPLVEKIDEQELFRSDTIINSFKTPTDKIV